MPLINCGKKVIFKVSYLKLIQKQKLSFTYKRAEPAENWLHELVRIVKLINNS